MRTIAHISDLHFGRIHAQSLPALRHALLAMNPDVLVVSGDLTQRARRREFEAARSFLDSIPFPRVVVPGNHDVPLHNVVARWLNPLAKYRQYIADDVEPFYCDSEIAIQGINTARSLTFKNGRINRAQIDRACRRLSFASPTATRIVVTHHPFDLPGDISNGDLVGRAHLAVSAFTKCKVDMILSGHFHIGHTANWARRYPAQERAALLVQAGTATSSRCRGAGNSWNLIRISCSHVVVERHSWTPDRRDFAIQIVETFERRPNGWVAPSRGEAVAP